jgi:hypothetical protein
VNKDTENDDISQVYQSLSKDEPNSEIDKAILAAAKANLDKQTIINKKNTQAWWLNGRFHGAVAASLLLVCLVYILPKNYLGAPDTQADLPALSLSDAETQTPSEQKMQMRMLTQSAEAESMQKSAVSIPQTAAMRESQPAFNEVMDTNKLSTRFSNADDATNTAIQTSEILMAKSKEQRKKVSSAQKTSEYADISVKTEKLSAKLVEIQEITDLSHSELIEQSSSLAEAQKTEGKERPLIKQYERLHQELVSNLSTISRHYPANLEISKYRKVLSEQEYLAFLEATKD